MTPIPIGLPERFRIDREVGRGGMAVVYRAHDRHLGRFVAIKVLSPDVSHAVGVERFQREIALTAKLVHPGIVALFDSGEADGQLYYVMPFVAGETLRARLSRERRMTMEDATAVGADVAEALAFAHGAGIVHRDVKPENIFTVGGRALLADFGIARMAGEPPGGAADCTTAGHLTTAGTILGTITYMSPEQASGDAEVDGRSDLYSLGCVLYEMLSGAPPFTGAPLAILAKHRTDAPQGLGPRGIRTSPALEQLILALLAKDPAARPGPAGDVARALRATPQSWAAAAPPTPTSEADRLVAEGTTAYRFGTTRGPSSRSYLDQARVYFERALAVSPQHARGLCALGNVHFVMGNFGLLPREDAFARGRDLVLQALAADDRCAEVHNSMGKIALYYDDDCHAAARHVQRAVALDPMDSEIRRFQSIVHKILGRVDEAVRAAQAATAESPDVPALQNCLGDALLAAGRNAEAVDALKRAIALQPGYDPAMERLELARVRLGELDLAIEIRVTRLQRAGKRDRAEQLVRDVSGHGALAALDRDRRRDLEEWLSQAQQVDPFDEYFMTRTLADRIVMAHAGLGEWPKAMDWVIRSYEHRPGRLRRMLTDLPFDRNGLAVDPRYARLLRGAGTEDLLV
jgi:tetratricopeptide (TPR) repeat protein